MTETTPRPEPWRGAVAVALERRRRDDRGALADLRRGIVPLTERYALPYVATFTDADPHTEKVLLRAVGIIAGNLDAPHSGDTTFGGSLRELFYRLNGKYPDADTTGTITRRVLALPSYDFDAAVQAIDGLVGYCGTHRVPMNFYNLTRLLFYWGNGVTDASIEVRNRVVRDFFTPRPARPTPTDSTTKD
ncbi:MAG: type I-E CRISPR-associated protein Cse2/CasB [Micrococcales bacterium]|nr:type I-E CRISPR-associated protein Cse2/CasB [Micrococcales bacterium]